MKGRSSSTSSTWGGCNNNKNYSVSSSSLTCHENSKDTAKVEAVQAEAITNHHHYPQDSCSYHQHQHNAQQQKLLASSPPSSSPPPSFAFIGNPSYSSLDEWKQRLLHFSSSSYNNNAGDGWCILAGVVAFGTTLCASTWTQQRLLGISTGTVPPIPSLVGLVTVCVASTAAHHAAIATHQHVLPLLLPSHRYRQRYRYQYQNDDQSWPSASYYSQQYQYPSLFSWHTVRVCAVGLLAFKILLGGRFWAISPSSYTHLGSFARPRLGSLPATENYASLTQRQVIQTLGKRFGCHTCGTRGGGISGRMVGIGRFLKGNKATVEFVGDHMPPKSVADQLNQRFYRRLLNLKVSFRFYPQCTVCSDRQGTLLSQATAALRKHQAEKATSFLKLGAVGRGQPSLPSLAASTAGAKSSYFHGWKFRFHHLTGGIVAAATVVNADSDDIQDGNQRRFVNWQYQTMNRFILDPLLPHIQSLSSCSSLRRQGRNASHWIQDHGGQYAQEWIQVHARQTNNWFVRNSRQAKQWFQNNSRRR